MIRVDRDEALRYLGYAGQELDDGIARRFDDAVAACEQGLAPRCVRAAYRVDPARSGERAVALQGSGFVLEGRDIARHLAGAVEVVLVACTLGEACERELRRRTALSPTDGLLYGAAASALVEAAVDAEDAAIVREAAARGLRAGSRYSPGFGDFPLEAQPAFLAALDAPRRIGLSCTAGNLLVPTKSVTAVIGLFDGPPPVAAAASCASCALEDRCPFKLQGRTCHG